mmetsp:Transcript_11006/g.10631  ORF Transcript_11006/g.10631 Transcript_11006/m.10631 type:complete len:171 (-) Transcript_11006:360-872(-)|eukprot:CAMPEP_0119042106 /NCGR_PEP_ID=MMETSP1177-20130426/14358_1 /TAXON_ID=2985 /ORGANISM="Ochromonas sp, Strain CCMP1899" /LENGTH=170 /DNA_ID=CAMNT_0007008649 /DNA_START=176 /DNA_END=688 /DNA_ORIENTATION=-
MAPIVASPEAATNASREVRTGLEHGEATNAEVPPKTKACAFPEDSIPCLSFLISKEGKSMFTIPNKYNPIVKNKMEDNNDATSPIAPDDPKTLPSIAADKPNKVSVVANPVAYKIDLDSTLFSDLATAISEPLKVVVDVDLDTSEPPRYVRVSGSNDIEHGEKAVSNPAP